MKVWFIDVSQSIEPTHPHGLEFLFRDCRNVATVSIRTWKDAWRLSKDENINICSNQFFQKAGVSEALNVFELFNMVSGLQINSDNEADFLAQVRTSNMQFALCEMIL